MFQKRILVLLALLSVLFISAAVVFASAAKDDVAAAALKEGHLYIYESVGQKIVAPLIKEFQSQYPGITVDAVNMAGNEVFSRHMQDVAARRVSADIFWSREVPLQASLVKGGYSLPYRLEEAGSVMPWAVMADAAHATAFEPVVMVYNRQAFSKGEYPASHKLMPKSFKEEKYRGRIGTCDPAGSELAFLLLTQDLAFGFDFWGLTKSFGAAGLKLFPDYSSLLAGVSSGEIIIAYNVPFSEVKKLAGSDRNIGWYYPADYILALPQITMIARQSTHPNAAKLWTDFLFSVKGQQIISAQSDLLPVREDAVAGEMARALTALPAAQLLKPVGTGPEVTRYNEAGLRRGFLLRWKQLLGRVK